MKPNQPQKPMTLGELIESGYRACGRRRARGIIWLAAKARLIVFQGQGPSCAFLQGSVNEAAMSLSASPDRNAPRAAEGKSGSTPIFT
jgi:G3E family GTPase